MPRPSLRLPLLLPVFVLAACAYGNDPAPPPRSTALPPPSPAAASTPGTLPAPVPPAAASAAPRGPQPVPVPVPARGGASAAGPSSATIASCRAEAERAAVTRNRGDLMRLEGRDVDLGDRNRLFDEQVRGFAQQDRDRLFRECISRTSGNETPR